MGKYEEYVFGIVKRETRVYDGGRLTHNVFEDFDQFCRIIVFVKFGEHKP